MFAKFLPSTVVVVGVPILMSTTNVGLFRSTFISAALAFAAYFLMRAYKYI